MDVDEVMDALQDHTTSVLEGKAIGGKLWMDAHI